MLLHQPLAQHRAAHRVGGGGDIDDQFRPESGQLGDGIGRIDVPVEERPVRPGILADRHPRRHAGQAVQLPRAGGLEVPVLVEDVVGWQERLADARGDPPVAEDRGAVEQRIAAGGDVGFDEPDDHIDPAGLGSKLLQRLHPRLDERGLLQQVARGIAREGELREKHEISAGRAASAHRLRQARRIPLDVPNDRIQLREVDLHFSPETGSAGS